MDLLGDRNLTDLLEERAERQPDKTFVIFEDTWGNVEELTYEQFRQRVEKTAVGFAGLGVGYGDKVTVHMYNCTEFLVTMFALARLGAVMVPSNTANTGREVRHVLTFSDSVALLTEPRFMRLFNEVLGECPNVRHLILARADSSQEQEMPEGATYFEDLLQQSGEAPRPQIGSEDVAEMIFTSGTTSHPKGVLLTHANCLSSGERSARSMVLDETYRSLTALPLFHVNAQSLCVLPALTVGATCIILEQYSAQKFWRQVRTHRATHTSIVAMQARTLLAQPPSEQDAVHELRRVNYAINIGDEEKERFEYRFGVELVNGYGLSEAMTVVTLAPVFGPKRWPSIGLPQHGREVKIADAEGHEVPRGEVGEILVHGVPGRTIMKGYYKDTEATAAVLENGWLHTGDFGRMDEKGYVYFFDRKKDVIKKSGENISASEVEKVLIDHPNIVEAAVIPIPDPVRDETVKAFVVLDEPGVLTEADIAAYCKTELATFKVPTFIEFRETLPKTSIGKVQKKILQTGAAQSGEQDKLPSGPGT